jgi:outer membrane porin, OprD family
MGGTSRKRGPKVLGAVSIGLVALVVVVCVQPAPSAAQSAPAQPASAPPLSSAAGTAPSQPPSVPSHPQSEPAPSELQLQPEQAPAPERPVPPLRRYIPGFQESLEKLPPFIRDTDLNLHFRTFYFDRVNPDDSVNEAWAAGGWLEYRSGWLFDTFRMGAVGYTSQPLYAPDDKDGTQLLETGQEGITVLGQAYGQLRYQDYALLTGYRQLVDDGYVNRQDNRMIPNTFEGVTLKGQVGFVAYNVGYLWDIKPRNSDEFVSMSQQAGGTGPSEGLVLTSVTLTPWKPLNIYVGNDYVPNVFNTVFAKGEYTQPLTEEWKLQVGLQYTNQQSVGDAQIGDFSTWNVGLGARLLWRGLGFLAATHFTGDGNNIQAPYGTWPGYLSLIQTDFDHAGEKAWGVGLTYDFGGTLLPFQAPGFLTRLAYARGTGIVDPSTGASKPDEWEVDLDLTWNVRAVKGLQVRFRNAYWDNGGTQTGYQFRVILNYEFDLL